MAAVLLCSCAQGVNQNVEEVLYEGNKVTVTDGSPIISKLKYETVGLESFSSEMRTVGTVQAEPEHYAEVSVPFDGRIMRSYVKLGARVRAGQTLFDMSSPEFLEASKSYFQTVQNYTKAKSDYDRKKTLLEHGIISQRELEESFAEAENARQDKESAEAMLKVYGMSPESLKMGQAMGVVAPISGEVVYNAVTTGSFTKADSDPLVTIADLGRVWVTALIKERFIGSVTKGGKAEVFIESEPDTIIWGDILNVGNLVDEETRSIQVVISCDNADLKLKHGMYVSVHFMSEPKEAVVIPSTALFQGDGSCYVYVCTDEENTFERRQVVIGESNDDNTRVCIRQGLNPGEKIISTGGLYLNN